MPIRKILEINEELCDGCGQCILDCAENALAIIDGKAKVISDNLCDGLGACLKGCPQNALTIIEREAVPFDLEAVAALHKKPLPSFNAHTQNLTRMQKSCPTAPVCPSVHMPPKTNSTPWPLKLRIIPVESSFLKDSDIILTSDCAPAVYANFHGQFGHKIKITCCPKFEDRDTLLEKLTTVIINAQPKSLEVLRMEVPCCSALMHIAEEAVKKAAHLSPKHHVCSRQGDLLDNSLLA